MATLNLRFSILLLGLVFVQILGATAAPEQKAVGLSSSRSSDPVVLINPCDGMEYADGETMIITPVIEDEWWMYFPAPVLRYKGGGSVSVKLRFTVSMTHGGFQECMGMTCRTYGNGTFYTDAITMRAGEECSTQAEWDCMSTDSWEYETGSCTAMCTIYVNESPCRTITIRYIYDTEGVLTKRIGSTGLATLYADRALTIPEGLAAYTTIEHNGYLKPMPISDGIIPARTGVILEGNAAEYTFYAAPSHGTADHGCLEGTLTDITNPGGTYVLSSVKGILAFYQFAEAATLKANHAYYKPSMASTSAFFFDSKEDDVTGLTPFTPSTTATDMHFDLIGRRLSADSSHNGIVLSRGKKMMR